jgi:hypothetical protein
MKIDAYGSPLPAMKPAAPRAATPFKPESAEETDPHEKFRRLLDEKRHLATAAFQESVPESELGKHIDLRV